MQNKEAKFGILLRHWIKANYKKMNSAPIEIKDTRGKNRISFREIKEDQLLFGLAAKSDKGVLMRNLGGNGEPDYCFYRNSDAWTVIKFPDSFYIIDTVKLYLEIQTSKEKSLTKERASELASDILQLK